MALVSLRTRLKIAATAVFTGMIVIGSSAAPAVPLGADVPTQKLSGAPVASSQVSAPGSVVDLSAPVLPGATSAASLSSGSDRGGRSGGAAAVLGDACDNGANAGNCTIPKTAGIVIPPAVYSQLPADTRSFLEDVNRRRPLTWMEISPINHDGSASCTSGDNTHTCGYYGTAPIAGFGSTTCSTYQGCGYWGTGPVAVGGNNTCSGINSNNSWGCGVSSTPQIAVAGDTSCNMVTPNGRGCGFLGTGPVAVGGKTTCSSVRGCGWLSTGPVAVGGSATCNSTGPGCGYWGTGPISPTGNVSCTGTCGKSGTLGDACTLFGLSCGALGTTVSPRTGTPGVSGTGTATCNNEFQTSQATNASHLQGFECISAAEVVGPTPTAPPCAVGGTLPGSVSVTCRVDPLPAPPCAYVSYNGSIGTSVDPQSCIPGP